MRGRRGGSRWRLAAVGVLAALTAAGCSDGDPAPQSTIAPTAPATGATQTVPRAADVAPATSRTPATTTSTPATPAPGPAATPPDAGPGGWSPSRAATVDELLELGRPLVLAHTGGEDAYPGSTMFAFGESLRAGVDVLDLNVVLSADGVLMVQHDDTVDRLTEATGPVAAMTAAELQMLDNAYWFTPDGVGTGHRDDAYVYRGVRTGDRPPPAGYAADDFAIPRLDGLIARYPDVPLNIEIKGEGEPARAAAEALAVLLRDTGREPASVVTAFDDATVAAFHAAAPGVEVSPGLGASTEFVLAGTPLPDGMRILQLPPEYQGVEVLTPATVTAAHAAGYVIWVWPTVPETPELYDALLAEGMDALNANHPEAAVLAVQRFLATS